MLTKEKAVCKSERTDREFLSDIREALERSRRMRPEWLMSHS